MQSRFVSNNGINLHYINQEGDEYTRIPLIYIPGMLDTAESLRSDIRHLGARRVISLSRRGHGKSDAPRHARYGLESAVSDIESVINDTHITKLHLMAYSAGVPMALKYALRHQERIASLLLLDFPARYPTYSQAWAEQIKAQFTETPDYVIDAIARDAEETTFWDKLDQLTCPVQLIFGEKSDVMSREDVERYERALPHIDIVRFTESGHRLWEPDYQRFIDAITTFLEQAEEIK